MATTLKGDKGFTDLIKEDGVSKSDSRIEAIGAVDEAWSALGFARAVASIPEHKVIILHMQNDLHLLMSQLAGNKKAQSGKNTFDDSHTEWLEKIIDDIKTKIVMPKAFIVSGDTLAGAALALARSIVRRAERRVVSVVEQYPCTDPTLIKYLNRLSEACFFLELAQNA